MADAAAPTLAESRVLNINVGILGHVDSGKTSLVKALSTTLSTAALDKHPQSQQRGITLDLGFSAFTLPLPDRFRDDPSVVGKYDRLQFTLVDCPGHASLIRTIIGGAQIIDMIVLVVDVMKGIQTQTAECIVLGEITAHTLLIALNKVDLLPPEEREERIQRVSRRIRKTLVGSKFAQAQIVPVSACVGGEKVAAIVEKPSGKVKSSVSTTSSAVSTVPMTGAAGPESATSEIKTENSSTPPPSNATRTLPGAIASSSTTSLGMAQLVETITSLVRLKNPQSSSSNSQASNSNAQNTTSTSSHSSASSATTPTAPFYFAIDHCFAVKGHGTVLTGTVLSGSISVGQMIDIPSINITKKKVKSLQIFRKAVSSATTGDRVGLCVTQLDAGLLERGFACTPETVPLCSAAVVLCRKVRFFQKECKSHSKVHVTLGHSTVVATVVFFGGQQQSAMQGEGGGDERLWTPNDEDRAEDTSAIFQQSAYQSAFPPVPFDPSRDYLLQDALIGPDSTSSSASTAADSTTADANSSASTNSARKRNAYGQEPLQWALLLFSEPVYVPLGALVIASRLDLEDAQQCRLAFYGPLRFSLGTSRHHTNNSSTAHQTVMASALARHISSDLALPELLARFVHIYSIKRKDCVVYRILDALPVAPVASGTHNTPPDATNGSASGRQRQQQLMHVQEALVWKLTSGSRASVAPFLGLQVYSAVSGHIGTLVSAFDVDKARVVFHNHYHCNTAGSPAADNARAGASSSSSSGSDPQSSSSAVVPNLLQVGDVLVVPYMKFLYTTTTTTSATSAAAVPGHSAATANTASNTSASANKGALHQTVSLVQHLARPLQTSFSLQHPSLLLYSGSDANANVSATATQNNATANTKTNVHGANGTRMGSAVKSASSLGAHASGTASEGVLSREYEYFRQQQQQQQSKVKSASAAPPPAPPLAPPVTATATTSATVNETANTATSGGKSTDAPTNGTTRGADGATTNSSGTVSVGGASVSSSAVIAGRSFASALKASSSSSTPSVTTPAAPLPAATSTMSTDTSPRVDNQSNPAAVHGHKSQSTASTIVANATNPTLKEVSAALDNARISTNASAAVPLSTPPPPPPPPPSSTIAASASTTSAAGPPGGAAWEVCSSGGRRCGVIESLKRNVLSSTDATQEVEYIVIVQGAFTMQESLRAYCQPSSSSAVSSQLSQITHLSSSSASISGCGSVGEGSCVGAFGKLGKCKVRFVATERLGEEMVHEGDFVQFTLSL